MPKSPVNLDRNASYGLIPEVEEGLRQAFGTALNPSSIHAGGRAARRLIEDARDSLGELLRLSGGERVIFTSGATEANNSIIFSALESTRPFSGAGGAEFVCSAYEHPCVLEPIKSIERSGRSAAYILRADEEISAEDFLPAVGGKTRLVSLMRVNNETGEIFPTKEIFTVLRARASDAIFHSDAVQALGKTDFSFADLGADAATFSGHKIGALAGAGALVLRSGIEFSPRFSGGSQEGKERAGTENVLGIASLGMAARALSGSISKRIAALNERRDLVVEVIRRHYPEAMILNENLTTVPNTISVRFPGVRGDDLVVAADLEGVLISSGAACSSGKQSPSHVLLAMNLAPDEAREAVRISLGAEDTKESLSQAAAAIAGAAKRLNERGRDV